MQTVETTYHAPTLTGQVIMVPDMTGGELWKHKKSSP